MKVFVVEGTSGEYSDRTYWPVRAYMNEAVAKQEVEELGARAREVHNGKFGDRYDWLSSEEQDKRVKNYMKDPNFQQDYNATTYHYYAVDVVDLFWPEAPQ